MARYYRRKTHKLYKNSRLLMAARHTDLWNCSIREASGLYSIPYSTLRRCVQRSDKISLQKFIRKTGKATTMTKEQEAEFLANMCFQNRTFKQFRQLAFQQSQVLRLKVPTNFCNFWWGILLFLNKFDDFKKPKSDCGIVFFKFLFQLTIE